MPEGHTIHRLAALENRLFRGRAVSVSSPQGRFVDGARVLDGRVARTAEAFGKHLLQHFEGAPSLHVHLGLYGKVTTGQGVPPEPKGALRMRMTDGEHWLDLRGATACELLDPAQVAVLLQRLGPDPLRRDGDPSRAWDRLRRSRTAIGQLLMDQAVVAGVGNVYRGELLFRHRVDPYLPGSRLPEATWFSMWEDLVTLMKAGVRSGRIVTVHAEHRPTRRIGVPREDWGYVWRRTGEPCRVCGTPIRTEVMAGRKLFWCPTCQAPGHDGTR